MKNKKNTRLVYSTEKDWQKKYCPECGNKIDECTCEDKQDKSTHNNVIYLERSKKGRGGKTVTIISGLTGDLKMWKKKIQSLCASGGTIKEKIVEIQGDHRDKIKTFLESEGFKVKFKGG